MTIYVLTASVTDPDTGEVAAVTGSYEVADIPGLPPGLTLAPDGVISGTPTTPGTYYPVIMVTDADGKTDTKRLPLVVRRPVAPERPAQPR